VKQYLLFLFLGFLFASCATSSLPYTADYPLTDQLFHSRDRMFSGKIPRGWFSSTDDSLGSAVNALLIKEDYSATLTMKEIKLDHLASERVQNEGLKFLARLSTLFKQERGPDTELIMTEFELRGKSYCGYERMLGEITTRVVVFTTKGKYYECEIQLMKKRWSGEETKQMFTLQQTVLASLAF
jgi:hypothetical protein